MSEPTPQDRFDRAVRPSSTTALLRGPRGLGGRSGTRPRARERRWLQGLIQWAAAFVHFERGFHASGFVKLVREGRQKCAPYAGDPWGLDFARLLRDMQPWFEHAERVDGGAPLVEGAPSAPPRMHAL